MRRRLTSEEREIRRGSGIPFSRWWPILGILVALGFAAVDSTLFERCLGTPLNYGGRAGAAIRMLAAIPCSPFLFRGPHTDWLIFFAIWGSAIFGVRNYRWAKRHKAYWNAISLRDAARRKARKQALAENGAPAGPAD